MFFIFSLNDLLTLEILLQYSNNFSPWLYDGWTEMDEVL